MRLFTVCPQSDGPVKRKRIVVLADLNQIRRAAL